MSHSEESTWQNIKPTARPSIHSHSNCPFNIDYIIMDRGRFNNGQNNKRLHLNTDDESVDELDNIMSKFSYPIDLPSKNSKKLQRRRSLNSHDENITSDSSVLSKSLPTYFEKIYSSDDSDQNTTQRTNNSNQSSHNTSNRSCNESYQDEINYSSIHNGNTIERNSYCQWLLIPCILVILGVTYVGGMFDQIQNKINYSYMSTNKNIYDKERFYNDLYNIGNKYKVNDDVILKLQIGISSISQKQDTDSFMFVYNSKAANFDLETFNNFVNEIAFFAARYLRNESSTVGHIIVDSSKLVVRDSTELIEKYRLDLTKSGVLLFMNIDTLPSSLAMALHYYCDEYDPLVEKSAIFLTLDMANCSSQKSNHEHIEKCLSKKWDSVPTDNIRPLLTRVVSVVVDLTT